MTRPAHLAPAAAAALLLAVFVGGGAAARGDSPRRADPVIAILDTGVRASHQEFDYRGPDSTSDQFVAWWDFTTTKKHVTQLPGPGQLWDTQVADPYDGYGHGSLTAASAGALGTSSRQTPSGLPGAKLAIAKVADDEGSIVAAAVPSAVRWAVDTVHADVISISITSGTPMPGAVAQAAAFDAIEHARAKGVLVVVANGNGWLGSGGPGEPGWANFYSSSPSVLAVGGYDNDTACLVVPSPLIASTDPELVAGFETTGPSPRSDRAYLKSCGTSFATPWVAGFAAALLEAARAAGKALPVDRLEQLLKDLSMDTEVPPQLEGYGQLSNAVRAAGLRHAARGTLPARPVPDVSALYVESVAGQLRAAWNTTN